MLIEPLAAATPADKASSLSSVYAFVREQSLEICRPLEIEDYVVQTAPYMSPPKWHLGHTTWFFEMVMKKYVPDYRIFSDEFLFYFNSYYEVFGERIDKSMRGTKSRPTVRQVLDYRRSIDERMRGVFARLESLEFAEDIIRLTTLGLEHEMQHQELMVYDIKHLLCDLYKPETRHAAPEPTTATYDGEVEFEGGTFETGYEGERFAYDNEKPRHTVFLMPYAIDRAPVSNGEYLEFIRDGGYQDYRWWLSEGWGKVRENNWKAPLYWEQQDEGEWLIRDFSGLHAIVPDEPVTHVSFHEARAFAKWNGKRLPTEAEWEQAALRDLTKEGNQTFPWGEATPAAEHANLLDSRLWGVARIGAFPQGVSPNGCYGMIGDAWEWTSSDYAPYPGFESQFAEYNDKWFVNQKVLRGGSFATPRIHIRGTYRNFFYAHERWMICGFRCARTLK